MRMSLEIWECEGRPEGALWCIGTRLSWKSPKPNRKWAILATSPATKLRQYDRDVKQFEGAAKLKRKLRNPNKPSMTRSVVV
jgi:hypothetical protein